MDWDDFQKIYSDLATQLWTKWKLERRTLEAPPYAYQLTESRKGKPRFVLRVTLSDFIARGRKSIYRIPMEGKGTYKVRNLWKKDDRIAFIRNHAHPKEEISNYG